MCGSINPSGCRHSSLAALRQLRAHAPKIDRSVVRDVASDGDARAVVDAALRLARALGLRAVAEGVETPEQRAAQIALGCDELQGYPFGRPMPPEALPADGAVLPAHQAPAPSAKRPTLRVV